MAGLGWRRPNGSFSTVTTLLATRTTSSTYKPRCVFAVSGSVSWNYSSYLHLPSSMNPPSTETSWNSFRPSLHNPSLLMPANFRRQRKTISVPRGLRARAIVTVWSARYKFPNWWQDSDGETAVGSRRCWAVWWRSHHGDPGRGVTTPYTEAATSVLIAPVPYTGWWLPNVHQKNFRFVLKHADEIVFFRQI